MDFGDSFAVFMAKGIGEGITKATNTSHESIILSYSRLSKTILSVMNSTNLIAKKMSNTPIESILCILSLCLEENSQKD